jgi:hypothetical protein
VTATVAILVSMIVSFTLTPMMCSKLLKPAKTSTAAPVSRRGFYALIERGYMVPPQPSTSTLLSSLPTACSRTLLGSPSTNRRTARRCPGCPNTCCAASGQFLVALTARASWGESSYSERADSDPDVGENAASTAARVRSSSSGQRWLYLLQVVGDEPADRRGSVRRRKTGPLTCDDVLSTGPQSSISPQQVRVGAC